MTDELEEEYDEIDDWVDPPEIDRRKCPECDACIDEGDCHDSECPYA